MIKARPLHWSFYAFAPFTIAMLFLDSKWVLAHGLNGQMLANILVPAYFLAMYRTMPDDRLKKIMLLTVPVSAIGELALSQGVQLWIYKFGYVPFYVPFGHAIVVGSGFQLLWRRGIHDRSRIIIRGFLAFYAVILAGAALLAHDSLSAILGVMYFLGVYAMRDKVIYMFMPIFVLLVEFVGTAFGCWAWPAQPFNTLSTTNPPLGSIAFYVYLDMIVLTLGSAWVAARMRKPS